MGILFFLKGNRSVATGTTIYFLSYIIYYVFFVKKHLLIILFPIPTGRCASDAIFSLLPRIRHGLFNNTPLVSYQKGRERQRYSE